MPARPPDPSVELHLEAPRLVDMAVQTRADVRLMSESVDVGRRTVEVVWSTGAAVRRRDPWTGKRYDEVLSLEEAHVALRGCTAECCGISAPDGGPGRAVYAESHSFRIAKIVLSKIFRSSQSDHERT